MREPSSKVSGSEPKRRKENRSSTKMSDSVLESKCGDEAYVHILKDLAEAVKRPPLPLPSQVNMVNYKCGVSCSLQTCQTYPWKCSTK